MEEDRDRDAEKTDAKTSGEDATAAAGPPAEDAVPPYGQASRLAMMETLLSAQKDLQAEREAAHRRDRERLSTEAFEAARDKLIGWAKMYAVVLSLIVIVAGWISIPRFVYGLMDDDVERQLETKLGPLERSVASSEGTVQALVARQSELSTRIEIAEEDIAEKLDELDTLAAEADTLDDRLGAIVAAMEDTEGALTENMRTFFRTVYFSSDATSYVCGGGGVGADDTWRLGVIFEDEYATLGRFSYDRFHFTVFLGEISVPGGEFDLDGEDCVRTTYFFNPSSNATPAYLDLRSLPKVRAFEVGSLVLRRGGDTVATQAEETAFRRKWENQEVNVFLDVNGLGTAFTTDAETFAETLEGWSGYERLGPVAFEEHVSRSGTVSLVAVAPLDRPVGLWELLE